MTDTPATNVPTPSPVPGEDALKGLVALLNDILVQPPKPGSALHAITQSAFNGAIGEVHRALLAAHAFKKAIDDDAPSKEAEPASAEAVTAEPAQAAS